MISQPQYVWHHMNFIWHDIQSLWCHTTLWHHTHCIILVCLLVEKGMANYFSFLPWEPYEQHEKAKWYDTEDENPGQQLPNRLLEKSKEMIPEGMKRLSQSGNKTQLWIWLVTEAKSIAVNDIAQESGMLGPWIKVNWKWPNKRWQEWTSTF